MRASLFFGSSSLSSTPAGRAANASLVGAKTVNGPVPLSVSTSPAALTAATRVEKSALDAATSTMVPAALGMAEVVGDEVLGAGADEVEPVVVPLLQAARARAATAAADATARRWKRMVSSESSAPPCGVLSPLLPANPPPWMHNSLKRFLPRCFTRRPHRRSVRRDTGGRPRYEQGGGRRPWTVGRSRRPGRRRWPRGPTPTTAGSATSPSCAATSSTPCAPGPTSPSSTSAPPSRR